MLISPQEIDDVRSRYRVSDAVRRRTNLRKRGAEWVGLCPFHKEKSPSFTVNDAKGFAHCFGCGWHGDIFRFIMDTEGMSFPDAVAALDASRLPPADPAKMAKEREEADERDRANIADALRFWEEAGPVTGTPADLYLCGRKIHYRPEGLRFGRVPSWRDDRGRWQGVKPALLLRAESLSGEFMGIQRIFLTEDGGKANMAKPKLSLGSIRGASIRFGRPASDVILTGGPEDGLTLYQRFERTTVYVSCGEAMLPFVKLPKLCRSVTIARQNDKPGMEAARKTREAQLEQGRTVRVIAPKPQFKDWNDELRGIVA